MPELEPNAPSNRNATPATKIGLPLAVLVISLVATLLAWYLLREAGAKNAKAQFQSSEKRCVVEIEHRMRAYEHTLHAVGAMVSRSDKLQRSEWHDFITELALDRYYPGIQAIGFAEVLAPQDLQEHLARMRSESLNDYGIRPGGVRDV